MDLDRPRKRIAVTIELLQRRHRRHVDVHKLIVLAVQGFEACKQLNALQILNIAEAAIIDDLDVCDLRRRKVRRIDMRQIVLHIIPEVVVREIRAVDRNVSGAKPLRRFKAFRRLGILRRGIFLREGSGQQYKGHHQAQKKSDQPFAHGIPPKTVIIERRIAVGQRSIGKAVTAYRGSRGPQSRCAGIPCRTHTRAPAEQRQT